MFHAILLLNLSKFTIFWRPHSGDFICPRFYEIARRCLTITVNLQGRANIVLSACDTQLMTKVQKHRKNTATLKHAILQQLLRFSRIAVFLHMNTSSTTRPNSGEWLQYYFRACGAPVKFLDAIQPILDTAPILAKPVPGRAKF